MKISIIIPCYKAVKTLGGCLDSIKAQTFTDWEVILINDGSPDETGDICNYYASKNTKIQVIHQENKGVSAARNLGIKLSKSEYILNSATL